MKKIPTRARGEGHGRSRLTVEAVLDIRNQAAEGASHTGLADRYGVSKSTISLVVRGKVWSHVGGPIRNGAA